MEDSFEHPKRTNDTQLHELQDHHQALMDHHSLVQERYQVTLNSSPKWIQDREQATQEFHEALEEHHHLLQEYYQLMGKTPYNSAPL